MGVIFEQIINVLNTETGNLTYNLVLSFSLAGALYFAIAAAQRDNSPAARRTILGLGLLLLLRLALFIASGLVWQGIIDGVYWLPIMDRAVMLISLVIIGWLWVFNLPSSSGDTAAILLGVLVVTMIVLGAVWRSNQELTGNFNHSILDIYTQIAAIVIIGLTLAALLTRRPEGWVLGLIMELLMLAGHVIYLIMPADNFDYPYLVRLFQMAAYPFLLLLAQRLPQPAQLDEQAIQAALESKIDEIEDAQTSEYSAVQVLKVIDEMISDVDLTRACHHACSAVLELVGDDICLLIDPPDDKGILKLRCAYDRSEGKFTDAGEMAASDVPNLSSSLRFGRTRRLANGSDVTDLSAIGKLLNRTQLGGMLYVPILSAAGSPLLMIVLLSPQKSRDWSREEQSLVRAFGRFLVYFMQHSNEMVEMKIGLEQTLQARRNAQDQAKRTLELNQKLRDQLVVLQDDNDQKAGRLATMAALLAAGTAAHDQIDELQKDKEALKAELTQLSQSATKLEAAQTKIEDLQAEIESMKVNMGELSETASQQAQAIDGELVLALEEIALLRGSLLESEDKIAMLKASLSEAPASNQQIVSIIDIAQDLRQPLSSIIGYTDFLLSEVIGILGDRQRKYLERIRISTERMHRLVDDLLQVASPEGNLARLDIEEIDLVTVIQRAIAQASEYLEERDQNLKVDMPDKAMLVNVDQRAMQRVFRRILDNACRVTPEGNQIKLTARVENTDGEQDYVLVQVQDSGAGIQVQDIPRVFTNRSGESMIAGLGVNGAEWVEIKALVEVHGGRIWVDSEVGDGSTFSILLPAAGYDDFSIPLEAPE